jgi:hypothetical protein
MSDSETTAANDFYVIAREPGAEHPALPTWATVNSNPAGLELDRKVSVQATEIDGVPGAFHLHNVLSIDECIRLIDVSESLGYLPDAAVSLPRAIRHNHNVTWVADSTTTDLLWQRCAEVMRSRPDPITNKLALGLNARFRFYRYEVGDFFKPHTDGAWPGSRVIDGELITDAFDDRWSLLSFIIFLSSGYEGGRTRFYLDPDDPSQPARGGSALAIDVVTPAGAVLCFPHGMHPQHCMHSSETIVAGTKYIIRTDMLFQI